MSTVNPTSDAPAAEGEAPPNDAYWYCEVCRLNHKQKRKHIYSQKHKEKVKGVLKKFSAKINEAEVFLRNPVVEEGSPDGEHVTFWCHFCKNKVNKHITDARKTILFGGVVEHLASETHFCALQEFWFINGVEEEKNKESYIISKVDLDMYKRKLASVVDEYDKKIDDRTRQVAFQIKAQEDFRKVQSCADCPPNSACNAQPQPEGGAAAASRRGDKRKLVGRESRGGNIFTGAPPPWLVDDSSETTASNPPYIGPSQIDLDIHREKMMKDRLNPNRVGANFDHTFNHEEGGHSGWLPSFGRVWNEEARWKSRRQYSNEVGVKRKKPM